MTDEQAIANVAMTIRGNTTDTLSEHFDATLDTVTAEQWAELGFKDDEDFFKAERDSAREALISMVGADHQLVRSFNKTWKRIVAHYYP